MEPREAALLSSILHLPAGITITSVHPSVTELVVRVACHALSMPCPECHQLSARIHGSYQRTVADLPCAGRNVFLMLTVRKFVCSTRPFQFGGKLAVWFNPVLKWSRPIPLTLTAISPVYSLRTVFHLFVKLFELLDRRAATEVLQPIAWVVSCQHD